MRGWVVVIACASCGRVNFDARDDATPTRADVIVADDVAPFTCVAPFVQQTTGCHHAVTTARAASPAQDHCTMLHPDAHLVVIDSPQEQVEVRTLFAPLANLWIGLVRIGGPTDFYWLTGGRPMGYTDWQSNDPNGEGACGRIEVNSDNWDDEPCSQTFKYVCELDGYAAVFVP